MKKEIIPYETVTDKVSGTAIHYNERIARKKKESPIKITKRYLEKYNDLPKDQYSQNRLIDECLEFVIKYEPNSIKDFPLSKGYSPYKFNKIALSNPYFSEVLDYAKAIIGRKIEDEWRHDSPASYARLYLPLYDKDYKEDRDALAKKLVETMTTYQAVLPQMRTAQQIEEEERHGESISDHVQAEEISGGSDSTPGT